MTAIKSGEAHAAPAAPFPTALSQQALERLNDNITKDFFRSTNHRNDALEQT